MYELNFKSWACIILTGLFLVAEEYDQLTERYGRLTDFLTTDKFGTLPENTQTLLRRQHQAMHDYREALRQRIRIDADAANLKVEIHDPDDE